MKFLEIHFYRLCLEYSSFFDSVPVRDSGSINMFFRKVAIWLNYQMEKTLLVPWAMSELHCCPPIDPAAGWWDGVSCFRWRTTAIRPMLTTSKGFRQLSFWEVSIILIWLSRFCQHQMKKSVNGSWEWRVLKIDEFYPLYCNVYVLSWVWNHLTIPGYFCL